MALTNSSRNLSTYELVDPARLTRARTRVRPTGASADCKCDTQSVSSIRRTSKRRLLETFLMGATSDRCAGLAMWLQ